MKLILNIFVYLSGVLLRVPINSKYTRLELIFAEYKWVRRKSKSLWVRGIDKGSLWVKFNFSELEHYRKLGIELKDPSLIIEDYR